MFGRNVIVFTVAFAVATVARAETCKLQPGLFNWWTFEKQEGFTGDRAGTNNAGNEEGSPKFVFGFQGRPVQ